MTALLASLLLLVPPLEAADQVIKSPAADSPEAPIAEAFAAAVAGNFEAYLGAIHPDHRVTPDSRALREQHEWARFLKQFRWYLKADAPPTFVVVSHRTDGDNVMRVFLRDQVHADRMPVPVRLKRDGQLWRIVVSSL